VVEAACFADGGAFGVGVEAEICGEVVGGRAGGDHHGGAARVEAYWWFVACWWCWRTISLGW